MLLLSNTMLLSAIFTVSEFTVVVVPDTCKLPVITIVSPESVPITMFSSAAPPEDSKFARAVNKLALLTSSLSVVTLPPKETDVPSIVIELFAKSLFSIVPNVIA